MRIKKHHFISAHLTLHQGSHAPASKFTVYIVGITNLSSLFVPGVMLGYEASLILDGLCVPARWLIHNGGFFLFVYLCRCASSLMEPSTHSRDNFGTTKGRESRCDQISRDLVIPGIPY